MLQIEARIHDVMIRSRIKPLLCSLHVALPGLTDLRGSLVRAFRGALKTPKTFGLAALKHITLRDDRALLDVGGADGQSVASMRFHLSRLPIVSFEPNPFFAARIKSRFRNDAAVRVESMALSDEDGEFPLYIPVYKYTAFPDLGTLERSEAENWLCSRILGYDPDALTVLEFPCKCRRLDALGVEPGLINIDCRCNPSKVLEGACATILEYKPAIILETAILAEACVRLVREVGYRGFRCSGNGIREIQPTEPCDLLLTDSNAARIPAC